MKKLSILATMLAITFNLIAQNQKPVILKQGQDDMEELKVMYINDNVSTHFISMENILYVDISNNQIVGDIPVPNILRLKPIEEPSLPRVTSSNTCSSTPTNWIKSTQGITSNMMNWEALSTAKRY